MRRVLFLLIFGVAGTAVLLGLGVWQVQRLGWKEALLADIRSRIEAAPTDLPVSPDPERDRYLPVEVDGEFEPEEIHVLVSIKQVGPGYRIISPFATSDGHRIMVDRGFVSEDHLAGPRYNGPARISGNLHWPRETDGFTPDPDIAANVWFARDVPAMAEFLSTEPVLLVARSQSDPNVTPIPVDTAGIPNDHLQYAITWFSLALIWAAMTGFFLRRDRAQDKG